MSPWCGLTAALCYGLADFFATRATRQIGTLRTLLILGVESAFTTTTTALTSLYSVVTVLLARAILRERLAPSQWAGVAVVLGGVLLVSI